MTLAVRAHVRSRVSDRGYQDVQELQDVLQQPGLAWVRVGEVGWVALHMCITVTLA